MPLARGPKCPNHAELLIDLPSPLTPKGVGTCPVSGCPFDYVMEIDGTKVERDINGDLVKSTKFSVSGEEK